MALRSVSALLLVSASMLSLLCPLIAAAEESSAEMPDLSKLRVKELQKILDDRGVTCNGCAEKADLVKQAKESYHLPLKKVEAEATADANFRKPEKRIENDAELDELIKKLNKGMGGSGKGFKMFRAEDLKGMDDEERRKKFSDEL